MKPKVLIANRGEIACRIIRTCRTLGFSPVAIYSEADATAQHVRLADEAWPVGPAPVRESYLNVTAILGAARRSGVQFIHPGYGLLSENAGFAEAVAAAGLVWIGPAAITITEMADKEQARELAAGSGVPVLPGLPLPDLEDTASVLAAGQSIGFPLLVKATGGGGGIGIRPVENSETLLKTAQSVADLADRTFGDIRIFLERYIDWARHIEVQVFGLGDGRVFHLFDRECSVQRRFQKVIEEAPAPHLSASIRDAMAAAACRLAAARHYAGAGTVEFVLDGSTGAFFFLEMNTRIQVEHPVTEMITGQDIVALQLRFAAGDTFDALETMRAFPDSHAIECRLYAENPAHRFLPSPGRLERLVFARERPGVRIDCGFTEGDMVTPYYDPIVAKVITSGNNRADAIARMSETLAQIEVAGIRTNLDFLQRVIAHPDFQSGRIDTRFVERNLADLAR